DGWDDGADLDPLVDAAGALDDEGIAVDSDGDATGLDHLAGLEGGQAGAPEEEGIDRGFEEQVGGAVEVVTGEQATLDEFGQHLLLGFAGSSRFEPLDLMALEPADADQEVEHAGEAGASGDVADATLVKRDRPRVPALDESQRPRF